MNKKLSKQLEAHVNKAVDEALETLPQTIDTFVKKHMEHLVASSLGFEVSGFGLRLDTSRNGRDSPLNNLIETTISRRISEFWRPMIEEEMKKLDTDKVRAEARKVFKKTFQERFSRAVENLTHERAYQDATKMAETVVAETALKYLEEKDDERDADAAEPAQDERAPGAA